MNDPDLLDRLRQLFVSAQRDGADPVWLADSADALVAKVLGLRLDPRRRRSHAEADRLGIVYAACVRQDTAGVPLSRLCVGVQA